MPECKQNKCFFSCAKTCKTFCIFITLAFILERIQQTDITITNIFQVSRALSVSAYETSVLSVLTPQKSYFSAVFFNFSHFLYLALNDYARDRRHKCQVTFFSRITKFRSILQCYIFVPNNN